MGKGTEQRTFFHTLDEWADAAAPHLDMKVGNRSNYGWARGAGAEDTTAYCRTGWTEGEEVAERIAADALDVTLDDTVEASFTPYHDVTGGDVDVGAFLSGEPECMIEYEPAVISKVGKVVTICASIAYSGSIGQQAIVERGGYITALALAVEAAGHSVELWADYTVNSRGAPNSGASIRVKGAQDIVDPSRIAFVYGHPAALRIMGFAERAANHKGGTWEMSGPPAPPHTDHLPDDVIVLPELVSGDGNVSHEQRVRNVMVDLGLLHEAA